MSHRPKTLLLVLVLLGLASCTTPKQDRYDPLEPYRSPGTLTHMAPGQTTAQGMIGAGFYSGIDRDGGTNPPATGDNDIEQAPTLGGAFQHAMWGDKIDFGLEVGGTLGFRSGGGFVSTGGGGLVVAVDIDMFLFDIFGGPFVNIPVGEKARLYGGAGPLLQFANWKQTGEGVDDESSGFGTGFYARTGFEFELTRSMLIGIGVRWYDSHVSLGGDLGSLDLQGTQALITFTSGV